MSKKTKHEIKIWGPLDINISERTRSLWEDLSRESIEKIGKNIDVPSSGELTHSDFIHVLELASRPKPKRKGKGRRKTSE